VLAGDFTVSGPAVVASTLSPGLDASSAAAAGLSSIGTARFEQTLTMSSTSRLRLEISSPTAFDKVIANALLLDGGEFFISTLNPLLPGTYKLLDFDALTVTAAPTINLSGIVMSGSAGEVDASRLFIDGTVTVTAIPEPRGAMLVGAAGLLAVRRRR
jgi:hypothetical protein